MNEDEAALADVLRFLLREERAEDAARRLITICGSLSGISTWEPKELCRVSGLPESVISYLSLMPHLSRVIALDALGPHPKIDTCAAAVSYLSRLFIGRTYELSYVLCLSRQRILIDCVEVAKGTSDETHLYIRSVLECVVRTRAAAIVLSHNHPSRTAAPSMEDIAATGRLIEALSVADVPLLDHIIIAGRTGVSLRGEYMHLLPEFALSSGDKDWFAP